MGRLFDDLSPDIQLGVTWEEPLAVQDAAGTAVDISGYAMRCQFHEELPERDPDTGLALVDPVFELTSAGFYGTAPDWPVYAGLSSLSPEDGHIDIVVPPSELWQLSTDNAKRKLYWSLILVVVATGYTIPVVSGKATLLPATTL